MNSPNRVIGFVNAAHFIDHYSMLIFAAAVIVMGPALGMAYSELLPYATPGFVAFGAGSLLTGWLGDRWSRRHMMAIFFAGIGGSMIAVGLVQTPLQLGALVTAIANGGTMYYLQHPRTADEVTNFQPIVKRHLDIAGLIPEISDGMAGAVEYGTARRLLANFNEEEVLGKTGTCSHAGTRYGWFASYANTSFGRVVVVVFLEGGRPTFGPKAAEIAGRMYHNLYSHDFFLAKPIVPTPEVPATMVPATVRETNTSD